MSFLYQALLKNNKGSSSKPDQDEMKEAQFHDHRPEFANSMNATDQFAGQSNPIPWGMWVVVSLLLLLIGLLAGYIFGNKTQQFEMEPSHYTNVVTEPEMSAANQSSIQPEPQQRITDKHLLKSEQTEPLTNTDDKQVEIALNEQGDVVSQVTKPAKDNIEKEPVEQKSPGEQQIVRSKPVNEVDIDDIPEQLKSSFADAVAASKLDSTESRNLFQVSSGSSLVLIDDLSMAEQYAIPNMSYQMHIYASDSSERWIRINGITLSEGEELQDDLTLVEIRQDQIIWQTGYRRFAQNALEDFIRER